MQSRAEEQDPRRVEEPSFRDAFARARLESLVIGPPQAQPDSERPHKHAGKKKAKKKPKRGTPARARMFEVRIERRSGRRSADVADWNRLGRDGWELVAVEGKHAFFRREL